MSFFDHEQKHEIGLACEAAGVVKVIDINELVEKQQKEKQEKEKAAMSGKTGKSGGEAAGGGGGAMNFADRQDKGIDLTVHKLQLAMAVVKIFDELYLDHHLVLTSSVASSIAAGIPKAKRRPFMEQWFAFSCVTAAGSILTEVNPGSSGKGE